MTTKVFGIGFHKTGTTSLAKALKILGYRVTGRFGVDDPDISRKADTLAYRIAEQYDAFQDNPWPVLYREMDNRFPGSKFILTVRPANAWINSVVDHFDTGTTPMREWIYGTGSPRGNEATYLRRYNQHNREILEYFRDREDDLLVMRITEGEGWERLCAFLGKVVPPLPFPHANRREVRASLKLNQ